MALKGLSQIFDSRRKQLLGALASLLAAYITGSLAIDRGSWWLYLSTMALLLLCAKLSVRLIRRVI